MFFTFKVLQNNAEHCFHGSCHCTRMPCTLITMPCTLITLPCTLTTVLPQPRYSHCNALSLYSHSRGLLAFHWHIATTLVKPQHCSFHSALDTSCRQWQYVQSLHLPHTLPQPHFWGLTLLPLLHLSHTLPQLHFSHSLAPTSPLSHPAPTAPSSHLCPHFISLILPQLHLPHTPAPFSQCTSHTPLPPLHCSHTFVANVPLTHPCPHCISLTLLLLVPHCPSHTFILLITTVLWRTIYNNTGSWMLLF